MGDQKKGFFAVKDSVCHTGTHLLLELWGARDLDSINAVKKAIVSAVKAANATLLKVRLHHFSPNQVISGVAIISESHISIHTYIIGGISNIVFTHAPVHEPLTSFGFGTVRGFATRNTEVKEAPAVFRQTQDDSKDGERPSTLLGTSPEPIRLRSGLSPEQGRRTEFIEGRSRTIKPCSFTSKKIKPQSFDFFSAIPKYKQFCRNTRYYNPKMHYRSFGLANHIENCMFN